MKVISKYGGVTSCTADSYVGGRRSSSFWPSTSGLAEMFEKTPSTAVEGRVDDLVGCNLPGPATLPLLLP